MFVVWMVHVYAIKFTIHIVFGAPPPILAISSNIVLWFIYESRFKLVVSPSITLVGVPYFTGSEVLGYVSFSSLNCCKERSFVFIQLIQVSC